MGRLCAISFLWQRNTVPGWHWQAMQCAAPLPDCPGSSQSTPPASNWKRESCSRLADRHAFHQDRSGARDARFQIELLTPQQAVNRS